jgi:hypothetical protein
MRPLLLIFMTFAVMFGLPRLADRFRGGQPNAGSRLDSVANAQAETPEAVPPHASSAAQPVSLLPMPPQVSPGHLTAHSASNTFSERDLIFAIEKELIRLGHYDGPAAGRWTRRVRLASRRFIRRTGGSEGYLSPTVSLLDSLVGTASAGKAETSGAGFAAMQPLQDSNVENLRSRRNPVQDYLPTRHEAKSGRNRRQIRLPNEDRRAAKAKHVHHRTRRQARIRSHRREAAWRPASPLALIGF